MKYIINEDRLKELLLAENKLLALENGGVDDWIWYGDSLKEFIQQWVIDKEYDENKKWNFEDIIKDDLKLFEVFK